jgi:hypothetical protein
VRGENEEGREGGGGDDDDDDDEDHKSPLQMVRE